MSVQFIIREATLADCDAMRALFNAVDELHRLEVPWLFQEPTTEARPRGFFERLLADGDSALLVAASGSQLVGVATALRRTSPDFALFINQSWGVLDNIAVAESWRRRGVGTALTNAAESWVRDRGAMWIELGVYEFNEAARSFYERLGYLPVLTKLRKPF